MSVRDSSLTRRMPAEWEPHAATLLQWPSPDGASFPGAWTPRIEPTFVELIEAITRFEPVELCVANEAEAARVSGLLSTQAAQRTRLHVIPTREPWCRDIGPTFVVDSSVGGSPELVAVKWRFNGWGDQWPYQMEEAAGHAMAAELGAAVDAIDFVFEGGGVESNGRGLLMLTEECVLDPMRNPGISQDRAEALICEALGADRAIWLRGGVAGDDTGHTDVVARFVSEDRVVMTRATDASHPDYELLEDNFARVSGQLEAIALPAPDLEFNDEIQEYLPKGYANFYVLNECVLVPKFGLAEDDSAAQTLASVFPDRELVAIDCNDLVFGQGGIHCLTQQVPALPTEHVGED